MTPSNPYVNNPGPVSNHGGSYNGDEMTFDSGDMDFLLGVEDATSIADIISGGTKGPKFPISNKPLSVSSSSGISAAAAAGIGAKAFMDKKNGDIYSESDDMYEDEEWDEATSIDTGYDEESEYLDDNESFGIRNMSDIEALE